MREWRTLLSVLLLLLLLRTGSQTYTRLFKVPVVLSLKQIPRKKCLLPSNFETKRVMGDGLSAYASSSVMDLWSG